MREHLCVVTFLPLKSPMCSFTLPDILTNLTKPVHFEKGKPQYLPLKNTHVRMRSVVMFTMMFGSL